MRISTTTVLAGSLLAGVSLLVYGCGGSSRTSGPGTNPNSTSQNPSSQAPQTGNPSSKSAPGQAPFQRRDPSLPPYPHVSGLKFPLKKPAPGSMNVVRAFGNLSFSRPVYLTYPPDGTNRVFVVEQAGTVYTFPNDDKTKVKKQFLKISVSRRGNEEGLLGFAFDPNYQKNGYLYVNYIKPYTWPALGTTVISRFTVDSNDPDKANPNSEKILMQVSQPYSNHNGGWLDFGPDGFLYIALGDGGSGGDPKNNGQNRATLLGNILRIDPHSTTGKLPYGIPKDNPFPNTTNVRPEIWAWGMRNPWRCSFDRNDGTLWCGDVGQGALEEIDIIKKGLNYGWRWYEGTKVYRTGAPNIPFEAPVIVHNRFEGRSITGGYVYRGSKTPSLRGAYVYGDYATGNLWALTRDSNGKATTKLIGTQSQPASFGEDEKGEVYVVSLRGFIYTLTEKTTSKEPPFPQKLSQTGLFSDTRNLIPSNGLLEYQINEPFWSDDAEKRRFISLPAPTSNASSKITFHATEPWKFPTGTVVAKHFELNLTVGDPTTARRLETRVLVKEENGWAGYVYKWNAAQTDADLLPGYAQEELTITDPKAGGGKRTQTWTYPGRANCLECHTDRARVLGVQTRQIHKRLRRLPGRKYNNQLDLWNRLGMFDKDIGSTDQYGSFVWSRNVVQPVDQRARTWLDTNCAMCHHPNGPGGGSLDLRYDTTLAKTGTVGVTPAKGSLGLKNPAIIRKGAKTSSVLWERIRRLDVNRMPPIGSNRVDQDALEMLGEWIDGLK